MIAVLSKSMTDPILRIRETRGLISKIAREFKITPGAVSQWRAIPADRLVRVEQITGIPRHELRPDLFEGMVAARPARVRGGNAGVSLT